LLFADGFLYATLGDRGARPQAQDLGAHPGSVIRLLPDGGIPADNPFINQPGALPEIYTFGNRNPQGLTLNSVTGEIWMHEHGPRGGDELNRMIKGANYGWPVISYGKEYFLPKAVGQGTHQAGMQQPVHYWTPSIAPSGMTFYHGKKFPAWRNSLFIGSLKFQELVRLELKNGLVVTEEKLLSQQYGRIRDVRVGPDDALYVLTDEKNGKLLKIIPTP
jgi:glucose/arabinose dehydrogenase